MRIALVVERFLPVGGGVEQAAWQVAHGLARAGDEVHVFAREAEPPLAQASGPTPRVQQVAVPRGWQPLRVWLFSRAVARRIAGAAPGFDLVHGFTRTRLQDVYRAGAGSHADYMLQRYGPRGAALRRLSPRHRVLLSTEARIFRDPRQWIQCVSAMVRDELVARFGLPAERLVVIHNGVDSRLYRPRNEQLGAAAALRALYAREDDRVWLFAGSGAERKGLDVALAALAACADRAARLWVAGRDPAGPWLRRARALGVADRVDFLGPRGDMAALYAAADGLLLPTRYDAFANVCLEAAASGLPIVTSGRNGAAELLGEAAIVVPDPEDHERFARALEKLADPARRAALGGRGREIALAHDWDDHVARLRALYRRVRAESTRRRADTRAGAPS